MSLNTIRFDFEALNEKIEFLKRTIDFIEWMFRSGLINTKTAVVLSAMTLSACSYDSVTLGDLKQPCPDNPEKECIKVACPPSEEEDGDDIVCVGKEDKLDMDASPDASDMDTDLDLDASPDASDMDKDAETDTSDMDKDAETDASDMDKDAETDASDMDKDAETDTSDMDMGNGCTPIMQTVHDEFIRIYSASNTTLTDPSRFIGSTYGSFSFTCGTTPISEFHGDRYMFMGREINRLEVNSTDCESIWMLGNGPFQDREVLKGWQRQTNGSIVSVLEHDDLMPVTTNTTLPDLSSVINSYEYNTATKVITDLNNGTSLTLCPTLNASLDASL